MPEGPFNLSLDEIFQRYQDALGKSNAANEQRYQEGLGLFDQRAADLQASYNRSGQAISQLGTQALSDIQRGASEQYGGNTQSSIDRGLFNSTVLDAMNQRTTETKNRGTADVRERQAGLMGGLAERAGLGLDQVLRDRIGFIEGVTDQGPDLGLYANLLQNYAYGQNNKGDSGRRNAFLGSNPFSGGSSGTSSGSPSGTGGGSQSGGSSGSGVGIVYGSGQSSPSSGMSTQAIADIFANQNTSSGQGQSGPGPQGSAGPPGRPYWVASGTYGSGWQASPPPVPSAKKINEFHYLTP